MASLQIRDMPDELYESLKNRAAKDRRSLAQQALVLLTEALGSKPTGRERRMRVLEEIKSKKIKTNSNIRQDSTPK